MRNVARVKEQSSTTGLASYDLASSGALYRRLRDEFATGERVRYYAASVSDFEEGIGVVTYGTPDVLSRDTIIRSSTGAKINWPSGTRDIFVDPLPGTSPVLTQSGAYTVTAFDLGALIRFTGSSDATFTLPAAAAAGDAFSVEVRNDGTANVTLDPNASEQIDGATTLILGPGDWALVRCSGAAWFTLRQNIGALVEDTAPDKAADFVTTFDASAGILKKAKLNKLGGLLAAVIADQKSSGTAGGAFNSGSWATRTLNTEVSDPDGIVSLASNQFTLGVGTFLIDAFAPAYQVAEHQCRIQNITDATTLAVGTNERSGGASQTSTSSIARAIVTIASGTKAFEIQHQCASSNGTDGFGKSHSFGTQQYATVTITKLA